MLVTRVYIQIEPRVSMPWHWNLVNEGSISLSKGASNSLTKNKVFFKRYDKYFLKEINWFSYATCYI